MMIDSVTNVRVVLLNVKNVKQPHLNASPVQRLTGFHLEMDAAPVLTIIV